MEMTDPISQIGPPLRHAIGEVYFGRTSFSLTAPDLVVETARTLYDTGTLDVLALGALGDVDGDGRADLGIGDYPGVGRQTHIIRGRASSINALPPKPLTESAELFQVDMAAPLLPGHTSVLSSLQLPNQGQISIAGAAVLEGMNAGDQLASSRSIGDINGDRFEDIFISGTSESYILFGPVSLAGGESIRDRADIIVNTGDPNGLHHLGTLASGAGDINGDGRNDLVFSRPVSQPASGVVIAASNTATITITTQTPHGLSTDDIVNIQGVLGNTNANGQRVITVTSPTAFQLNGISGNATYTSGGTWTAQRSTITTIFGAPALPRELGRIVNFTSSPSQVRWYQQNIAVSSGFVPSVSLIDWNGLLDSSGKAMSELLINRGVTSTIHSYIHNSDGSGSLSNAIHTLNTAMTTSPWVLEVVGDVNGDGRTDLRARRSPSPTQTSFSGLVFGGSTSGLPAIETLNAVVRQFAMQDLDSRSDGYADWVEVIGDGTYDNTIRINFGSQTGISPTRTTTINRNGSNIAGQLVTLRPAPGDFDGDGKADLAILEAVATASGTPVLGRVYVLSNIGQHAGKTIALANSQSIIESTTSTGVLTTINANGTDLNHDGLSDLLLGAARATGTLGSMRPSAGRLFAIMGGRPTTTIPNDNIDILTNRSITASGDFLVDRATGTPDTFPRSLDASQAEQWFKFTTLVTVCLETVYRFTPTQLPWPQSALLHKPRETGWRSVDAGKSRCQEVPMNKPLQ